MHERRLAGGWCPIFSCIFWLKNEVWGELRNRYFPVCSLKNTRDFTWTGKLKIIYNARGCVAFSSKVTFYDYARRVARIFMVPVISFRLNWKVKWLYKTAFDCLFTTLWIWFLFTLVNVDGTECCCKAWKMINRLYYPSLRLTHSACQSWHKLLWYFLSKSHK